MLGEVTLLWEQGQVKTEARSTKTVAGIVYCAQQLSTLYNISTEKGSVKMSGEVKMPWEQDQVSTKTISIKKETDFIYSVQSTHAPPPTLQQRSVQRGVKQGQIGM